jgi:Holliday junction DNA helicase RuvA
MIGYLKGLVLDITLDSKLLVGVGGSEPSIGYQVMVPSSPQYLGYTPGQFVELFVHTHVREDALDLFGFSSRDEKELFLILMTVNGIGPKAALGLLSKVPPGELIDAILQGDIDSLVKVPGVGKKTAERVIVDISDSLRKKVETGLFASLLGNARRTKVAGDRKPEPNRKQVGAQVAGIPQEAWSVFSDAKDALLGLGYREAEALGALQKILNADSIAGNGVPNAEGVVKSALRQLMVQRSI